MIILVVFGVLCGMIASIVGAGSSMMMTPLLLYLYPLLTGTQFTIQTITSATLALTLFLQQRLRSGIIRQNSYRIVML